MEILGIPRTEHFEFLYGVFLGRRVVSKISVVSLYIYYFNL